MTIQTIVERIEAKAQALRMSQDIDARFTLCGTRCRIWYGCDAAMCFGYKWPLMQGYATVTIEELAAHVHRFQF